MNSPSLDHRDTLHDIAHRAMRDRGLEPDFTPEAEREVGAMNEEPFAASSGRRDLRALLWCSIDNDDSRDLDQLSVAVPAAGGATTILVAIADVAARVQKGTALDAHAAQNTTSIYTPAGVFPMLPEKLSTDLTSLREGVDRNALVLEMMVDAAGIVTSSDVYGASVCNHAKLAYRSVAAWLDGAAPAPPRLAAVAGLEEQLRTQNRVAQAMRAQRFSHGALGLETTQTRPVFENDVLADLRDDDTNTAQQLIEDFMIGANAVTARFLEAHRFPSLSRMLRAPARWPRIVELAAALGTTLPAEPSSQALEAFLTARRVADPEHFGGLSLSVVKLLGRGEYAVHAPGQVTVGHFGLATKDYTHSTAPNRRFPDLVTQRLLKAALAGAPIPYRVDELEELAAHCTEQEDRATKVERQVKKSAAASILQNRVGEQFDAIVTGASPKGTWVRIAHPFSCTITRVGR